jgi:hypothetical protein
VMPHLSWSLLGEPQTAHDSPHRMLVGWQIRKLCLERSFQEEEQGICLLLSLCLSLERVYSTVTPGPSGSCWGSQSA